MRFAHCGGATVSNRTPVAEPPVMASEEDQARADLYALLAAVLARPPDAKLLEILRRIEGNGVDGGSEMTASWAMLRRAAESAEVEALQDEYHELFIGIGRGELMPYGSWYLTGFLMERPLAELRMDLQRLGFERQEDVREPEDHVAALCETMSMIVTGAPDSLETQREFFNKHVGPWMGRFFADLTAARAARFYRAVGLLGEKFLEVERTYLGMLV